MDCVGASHSWAVKCLTLKRMPLLLISRAVTQPRCLCTEQLCCHVELDCSVLKQKRMVLSHQCRWKRLVMTFVDSVCRWQLIVKSLKVTWIPSEKQ